MENILSNIIGSIVGSVVSLLFGDKKAATEIKQQDGKGNTGVNNGNIDQSMQIYHSEPSKQDEKPFSEKIPEIKSRKKLTNIIFIDDQNDFKVVSILRNSGWENTKIKKDLKSLDDTDLVNAHICFIDIHGVGKSLDFKEEGLGLASAIMDKYPTKKIIIYSAETQGDRFHDTLRKANAVLRKNADPYEFQNLVESFSKEINFQ